jgi:DNA repair exonuclease SbcCD nuclease subunit
MKIAFITDLHFGVHGNSKEFLDYQEHFFINFFKYIEENNINTIFSLGDEFENRKVVNFYALNRAKKMFFDVCEDRGIDLKVIVGNHSMFYKEDLDINSPKLLFEKYKRVEVIEEPTIHGFGSYKFLSVPWISSKNKEQIFKAITETDANFLLGHFEVTDIKLHKGWQFYKGLEYKAIEHFQRIMSGHYHLRLEGDRFCYIGTPYQSSWEDLYEEKGFEVFDTETGVFEYVRNELRIYRTCEYLDDIVIDDFDFEIFRNSYVRVIVGSIPSDYSKYEIFLKKLDGVCYDYSVNERYFQEVKVKTIESEENKEESTLDCIKRKTEELKDVVNDKELFKYLQLKYNEAMEAMDV